MRVVVTGAKGQLGQDIMKIFQQSQEYEVYGFGRDELDVTDSESVRRVLHDIRPDTVIHAAAYTNVDLAESEVDQAYRVNAIGSKNMAVACEEVGAKLVYVSTDYVFDGTARRPYRENDETNPLSVYGKSKLAGEKMVQTYATKYFIVRTSWVYGQHGSNFVKTMLRLAGENGKIQVVDDQIGSPTFSEDLAKFIMILVQSEKYGMYHASNSGTCSWYEFAEAIFEEAKIQAEVIPITTRKYPRPAPRPAYSVLDHEALRVAGFAEFRHWRDALKAYFASDVNNNL